MIHIVFQPADKETLKKSFDLDPTLSSDIIVIKDDYAVGPLNHIFTEIGIEERKNWWREVLAGGDFDGKVDSNEVNDHEAIIGIQKRLEDNADEIVWIWAAPNKHDVSGYYWLISQLKEYQGRIYIIYLNNLPFINSKGHIFYPNWLFEIEPKEFLKAKKLARLITLSEFEIDPDEWIRLCNENKGVRVLEGDKKLVQFDYDYYDSELKKCLSADFQKASKLIHSFLTRSKFTTGDMYLLWRLKIMISQGLIEAQGVVKNMKDFEVKLKTEAEVHG